MTSVPTGALRRFPTLRGLVTLTWLELRATLPLALTLAGAGALLLWGLAQLCGTRLGELGRTLPFLAPSLVVVLFALIAAETYVRDRTSGLARTWARAPVGRLQLGLPRLAVMALVGAGLWLAATAQEPLPDTFQGWPVRYTLTTLTVVAVLCGLAAYTFRNALMGGLVGLTVGSVPLAAIGALHAVREPEPGAVLLRIGLEVFLTAIYGGASTFVGISVLVVLAVSRGARADRPAARAIRALALAFAFVAPGIWSALRTAANIVHMPFDAADAQVTLLPSFDGRHVDVVLQATRDASFGRENTLALDRRGLEYEVSQCWSLDLEGGEPIRVEAPQAWPAPDVTTKEKVIESSPRQRLVDVEVLSLETKAVLARFRARAYAACPERNGTPTRAYVFLGEDLRLYRCSLEDGTTSPIGHGTFWAGVRRIKCSPAADYLCLSGWREQEDPGARLVQWNELVELTTGTTVATVEGIFWRWRQHAAQMLVLTWHTDPVTEAFTQEFITVGPTGRSSLPFDAQKTANVLDLAGERWLVHWRGGRITLHAADGSLLRTLREPRDG